MVSNPVIYTALCGGACAAPYGQGRAAHSGWGPLYTPTARRVLRAPRPHTNQEPGCFRASVTMYCTSIPKRSACQHEGAPTRTLRVETLDSGLRRSEGPQRTRTQTRSEVRRMTWTDRIPTARGSRVRGAPQRTSPGRQRHPLVWRPGSCPNLLRCRCRPSSRMCLFHLS